MRLQKVASSLVNSDQVGYLKGRYIGENIRIINDVMHYTTKEKISGILALIGGHGGRVVTLSPPTSEAGVRSPHGLKWESW